MQISNVLRYQDLTSRIEDKSKYLCTQILCMIAIPIMPQSVSFPTQIAHFLTIKRVLSYKSELRFCKAIPLESFFLMTFLHIVVFLLNRIKKKQTTTTTKQKLYSCLNVSHKLHFLWKFFVWICSK